MVPGPFQQDAPLDPPDVPQAPRVTAVVHPWQAHAGGGVVGEGGLAPQDVADVTRHHLHVQSHIALMIPLSYKLYLSH